MLFSALAQPRWPHHRTLQQKAAALHYSLCLNHPFLDGNKRFALVAMDTFLARNGAWLFASDDELIEFSIQVADHQLTRDGSAAFLERRVVRLYWSDAMLRRRLERLAEEDLFAIAEAFRSLDEAEPSIANEMFADLRVPLRESIARLTSPT